MRGAFLLNPSHFKQEITEFGGIARLFIEDHPLGGSSFQQLTSHLDDLRTTGGVVESPRSHPIRSRVRSIPNEPFPCCLNFSFRLALQSDERKRYSGLRPIMEGSATHVEIEALDPQDHAQVHSRARYHFDIASSRGRGFVTHFQQSEHDSDGETVRCSIPRVPTFVYHPLDVFDFMLGEIFEVSYRSLRSSRV